MTPGGGGTRREVLGASNLVRWLAVCGEQRVACGMRLVVQG